MNLCPRPAHSVAREQAWARHYARAGLRVPVMKSPRSTPNAFRLANYVLRRGQHDARQIVVGQEIRC